MKIEATDKETEVFVCDNCGAFLVFKLYEKNNLVIVSCDNCGKTRLFLENRLS